MATLLERLSCLRVSRTARKRVTEAEKIEVFSSTSPPTPEQSAELARGMALAGRPLEPPRFHTTGWTLGQTFTAQNDPDRVGEPWLPPEFVRQRDPLAQRAKTTSQDLKIPTAERNRVSFARVVRGVLDEGDCAELIARVNEKGYTPALINIGGGRQRLIPDARDGHRVIVDSPELTAWLLEVLRPHLPEQLPGWGVLVDLNERARFLCYTPGQQFAAHCDGLYQRPRGHPHVGDCSVVTVQLYLHDVPVEHGGATTFLWGWQGSDGKLPCQPCAGSVLLFTQDLEHEGSLLRAGLKYTLRTEAMYRSEAKDDERCKEPL